MPYSTVSSIHTIAFQSTPAHAAGIARRAQTSHCTCLPVHARPSSTKPHRKRCRNRKAPALWCRLCLTLPLAEREELVGRSSKYYLHRHGKGVVSRVGGCGAAEKATCADLTTLRLPTGSGQLPHASKAAAPSVAPALQGCSPHLRQRAAAPQMRCNRSASGPQGSAHGRQQRTDARKEERRHWGSEWHAFSYEAAAWRLPFSNSQLH